jgi:hypothetical protein
MDSISLDSTPVTLSRQAVRCHNRTGGDDMVAIGLVAHHPRPNGRYRPREVIVNYGTASVADYGRI